MTCRLRAIIELISTKIKIKCENENICYINEKITNENQLQEFLLLLTQSNFNNGNKGILVAQDENDEALMLINNPSKMLSWILYNPEINYIELTIKLCNNTTTTTTNNNNNNNIQQTNEFQLIRQIDANNFEYLCIIPNNDNNNKNNSKNKNNNNNNNNPAYLGFSKDPTNSLHFRVKELFSVEDESNPDDNIDENLSAKLQLEDENIKPPELPDNIVIAIFEAGPLGMTLRRRNDGIVYVHEVDPGTQAEENKVQSGDLLWEVGSQTIGGNTLTKDEWTELVTYIKNAERPLQMLFQRNTLDQTQNTSQQSQSQPVVSQLPLPSTSQPTPTIASAAVSQQQQQQQQQQPSSNEKVDSNNITSPISETKSLNEQQDNSSPPLSPTSTISSPIGQEESQDLVVLKRLATKLIFKEKEKQADSQKQKLTTLIKGKQSANEKAIALATEIIVKPGRKLIKHGAVSVPGKMALWNVQNKKILFLITDLLLITVPQADKFIVESYIELAICKINIRVESDLIDPTTTNKKSVFELIYPGGSLLFICDDVKSKDDWAYAIYNAICDGVDMDERKRVIGWRHQYLIGTMHSAVLSRDIRKVRGLLESCAEGDLEFHDMETQDEEQYTPLHYACLLRLTNITRILHESSVDVTIPDSHGLTALHWAALQLDWEALEMLCTHVFHVDILDLKQRSPLYLACVEGRDVKGHTDIVALKKCVECLLNAGANPNLKDKEGLTCLHYLCASWQYPVVDLIIKFGRSNDSRPLSAIQLADINIRADSGGWTPLHYACSGQPLKRAIGEGQRILQSGDTEAIIVGNHDYCSELQPWIQSSDTEEYEQTNQADSISTIRILLDNGALPNLADYRGRRPLTILADNLYRFVDSFQACIMTIISHGGRLEEPLPEEFKAEDAVIVIEEGNSMWNRTVTINGDDISLRLKEYEGRISASLNITPSHDSKTIPCTLCGATFTLFKRQHHCRLCDSLCCDDCSKKRIIISKSPVRICDGCFNIASSQITQAKYDGLLTSNNRTKTVSNDAATKEALFQGASSPKQNSQTDQVKSSTESTMAVMSDAKLKLQERGDKLEQLSDKSAKLADASREFANMAKQLRQQQQQQNSWW